MTDLKAKVKANLRKWPKKLKQKAKKVIKSKAKTEKPRKTRKTARDFGDDPRIRQKYGEAAKTHSEEPWELRYAREKAKKKAKVTKPQAKLDRSKRAKDFGDDPKIRRKHGEAAKSSKQQWWEVDYAKRKAKRAKKPAAKKKPKKIDKGIAATRDVEKAKQQRKQATKTKVAAESAKTAATRERKAKEAVSKAREAKRTATKVIESEKAPPSLKKTARATRRAAKKTEKAAEKIITRVKKAEAKRIVRVRVSKTIPDMTGATDREYAKTLPRAKRDAKRSIAAYRRIGYPDTRAVIHQPEGSNYYQIVYFT